MRNEIVKSLVVHSINPVKEISLDKYNAPFIVEGGALFKNGIKVGFCKDKEPCDGTISSNNNKLLFFTNNRWHNITLNGMIEYKNITVTTNELNLNLNIHNLYNIYINNVFDVDLLFTLNDTISNNLFQNVELIFNNLKNNTNFILNIKNDLPMVTDDKLVESITINNNSIKILKLKILDDIIIVE